MYRPIIAISVGDPGGIGPEITAKALSENQLYQVCRPLVIAEAGLMAEAIRIAKANLEIHPVSHPDEGIYQHGIMDVLDMKNIDLGQLEYGKITKMGGEASFQYVVKAIELAQAGLVDATTTGPIHKEAVNLAGHHYSGHTEIYADLTHTKDYCMMLADKDFRVSHVTTHVPLRKVADLVTKERVFTVIKLTYESLIQMGIENPRIGVAGLNPHASDGGLFGDEERLEITPAIEQARLRGIQVEGPIPPDTVFVKLRGKQYDAIVTMYHDQGHIPAKLMGFKYEDSTGTWGSVAGINITLGLPIIRTSVDHGVAFDQAGKGSANPESMLDALVLAAIFAGKK